MTKKIKLIPVNIFVMVGGNGHPEISTSVLLQETAADEGE